MKEAKLSTYSTFLWKTDRWSCTLAKTSTRVKEYIIIIIISGSKLRNLPKLLKMENNCIYEKVFTKRWDDFHNTPSHRGGVETEHKQ